MGKRKRGVVESVRCPYSSLRTSPNSGAFPSERENRQRSSHSNNGRDTSKVAPTVGKTWISNSPGPNTSSLTIQPSSANWPRRLLHNILRMPTFRTASHAKCARPPLHTRSVRHGHPRQQKQSDVMTPSVVSDPGGEAVSARRRVQFPTTQRGARSCRSPG